VVLVIGMFVILAVYAFISPENHQRIYASRNPQVARKAGIYSGIFFFIIVGLVFLIGIVGLVFYPNLENPDHFFPKLAVEILPVWLGSILLASVAAAVMSSADTALITASSIFITDFYNKDSRKNISEKKILKISRLSVIVIGVIAFIVAFIFPTVADLVLFYNSLLASVALAPIVFGLFWKRASKAGAFYGSLSGGLTNIVLFISGADPTKSMLPSIIVACVVLVVLSLRKT
jgi:SSS family solute:Na+ symporter